MKELNKDFIKFQNERKYLGYSPLAKEKVYHKKRDQNITHNDNTLILSSNDLQTHIENESQIKNSSVRYNVALSQNFSEREKKIREIKEKYFEEINSN